MSPRALRVEAFTIEPSLNTISGEGGSTPVEPKVMEVLPYLAEYAGEVISRERLIKSVWEGPASNSVRRLWTISIAGGASSLPASSS